MIQFSQSFVRWQNMLTPESTNQLLADLRPDVVLSGHDHNGCMSTHLYSLNASVGLRFAQSGLMSVEDHATYAEILDDYPSWTGAIQTDRLTSKHPGMKHAWEITMRSSMAEFGGDLGLFEVQVE
jgi:hypothetical protein